MEENAVPARHKEPQKSVGGKKKHIKKPSERGIRVKKILVNRKKFNQSGEIQRGMKGVRTSGRNDVKTNNQVRWKLKTKETAVWGVSTIAVA